jgi:polyphenol oxidase
MEIIKSKIFEQFPDLIFGISTKIGLGRQAPFYFNNSLTVGDDERTVWENRDYFFNQIGLKRNQVALQLQIHSDIVTIVNTPAFIGESDAMITDKKMVGLAISTADCTPIFIYDKEKKVVAGVHSGWRGTAKRILEKALLSLKQNYMCNPKDLYVYIGPCISQKNYEVGEEVARFFDPKYLIKSEEKKYLLDVKKANYDILIKHHVPEEQIEISPICSFTEGNMHSFRRDKENSGRSLGVIAMKEINEI